MDVCIYTHIHIPINMLGHSWAYKNASDTLRYRRECENRKTAALGAQHTYSLTVCTHLTVLVKGICISFSYSVYFTLCLLTGERR